MKKRYQIEKYTILFAIGGMAYFAGSFSTWIFTLFDVFMWWGMFPLLWASKRKCKDQDKFY